MSFGIATGRPVFMDEEEDSYFLLEPEPEKSFLESLEIASSATAAGQASIASLGGSNVERAVAPPVERSLPDDQAVLPRPRLADAWRIARLLRRHRQAVERAPISSVLDRLTNKRTATGETADVAEAVLRFAATRRLLPIAPHCLTDSLALISWLPRSADLLLVFGVKLDPFAAHCWVQLDDVLLNDRAEFIVPFSPVRVIRCGSASR